ncbi:transposase [Thermodesulfobacteriota bacterium]
MSRPLRLQYPGAWYLVVNRGRRDEKTFLNRKDYLTFLDLLQKSIEIWQINIAAYCLLPNH